LRFCAAARECALRDPQAKREAQNYRSIRHSGNSGKTSRFDAFALVRRLSFMTAVTTTRFDERRTTTFGLVGGITFCESMVPLISPPFHANMLLQFNKVGKLALFFRRIPGANSRVGIAKKSTKKGSFARKNSEVV
jgi:hypothetical protein